ncbi:MAG: PAS domain S-box protein [Flammeovirgaceae bacterium]
MILDYKQLFKVAFEHQETSSIVCLPDGTISYANQHFYQFVNHSTDVTQSSLAQITHPDDFQLFINQVKQFSTSTIEVAPIAIRFITASDIYQLTSTQLTFIQEGTKLQAIVLNISPVNQPIKTLKDEVFFRHLYEESPIPIVLKTLHNRRFAQANQKFCDLVGYSLQELQTLYVDDITHPDDVDIHLASYKQLMEGKIPSFTYEKRYIRKDGSVIWVQVSLSLIHDDEGNVFQSIAMVQDITAHHQAKTESYESEQRLRLFFDHSPLAIAIRDYESEILIMANDRFCELMGYTREELIGQPRSIILHTEQQEKYDRMMKKMIEGKISSFSTIKTYKTQNGKIIWCEVTRGLFQINDRIYISATIQDITEKRKIEQESKSMSQTLKNLIAFLPIIYYKIDANGIFTESRGSGLKSLGLDEDAVVGMSIFDAYGELSNITEAHKIALAGGYKSFETSLVGPNGKTVYYDTIIFFDQANGKGAIGLSFEVTESKNTIFALKESEERYRTIFEMSEEGMILADVQNRKILECNQAMMRMLAVTKADIMNANPLDFCPPFQPDGNSSRKKYLSILKKAASQRAPISFEWRQITKNGRVFDAEVTVCPILKENQQLWLSVTRDITEKKKREKDKERVFEEQQYIFDAMPLFFFFKDTHNNIIRCNKRAADFLGSTVEKLSNVHASELFPQDAEHYYQDDLDVIRSKKPKLGIIERKNNGDESIWVTKDKFPHFDEEGNVSGILVFAKEVTELYAAQEALKLSEAKYRDIFENVNDSIIMLDAYANVIEGNKAAQDLLELNPREIINFNDLIHPEDLETSLEYFKKVQREGSYEGHQTRIITRSKQVKFIEVNSASILDEEGNFIGSKDIVRDITDRMLAQQELEERNNYLKKINAELDHFVYRASHDLRAPLSSLLGLIEVIKMNETVETNIDLLNKMSGQINKLENFIKEIIDYSRVSRTGFNVQALDIRAILEEILEDLRFMEHAEQISTKISVEGFPSMAADKRSLDIILNNLLSNAIKYADPSKQAFIHIHVHVQPTQVRIVIKDNGIGIREEFKAKIFDMFFRATDQNIGSGLGLFIVKEAVQKLNGTIEVESTYGEGSQFTILFPNLFDAIPATTN